MVEVVVLDASAILDGAFPGPRFDILTALAERFAPAAPALLAYELGNVVHGRRASAFGADTKRRAAALELLLAGVKFVPSDEGGRLRAARLATAHGLTFYDASYLELAAREGGRLLVTQDRGLLAAARRELGKERAADLDGAGTLLARAGP